jgi:hypothetical protein
MRAISAWRSNSGIFWRIDEGAMDAGEMGAGEVDAMGAMGEMDADAMDAGGAFWRGAEAMDAMDAEVEAMDAGPFTVDC